MSLVSVHAIYERSFRGGRCAGDPSPHPAPPTPPAVRPGGSEGNAGADRAAVRRAAPFPLTLNPR